VSHELERLGGVATHMAGLVAGRLGALEPLAGRDAAALFAGIMRQADQ
jgi:hypothetical protein